MLSFLVVMRNTRNSYYCVSEYLCVHTWKWSGRRGLRHSTLSPAGLVFARYQIPFPPALWLRPGGEAYATGPGCGHIALDPFTIAKTENFCCWIVAWCCKKPFAKSLKPQLIISIISSFTRAYMYIAYIIIVGRGICWWALLRVYIKSPIVQ